MSATLTPASLEELVEAVRSTPRMLALGAGTKPRLSAVDVVKVSTAGVRGIIEYDPGEFTFTALAGTPVREIAAALAGRGQYLPFDPMWLDAGATLGGTVASGVSGPGRLRYGGLRDFILGVRFVDGLGRLLRMGGKVVKNAAGFDLPKFFVGSLGRHGVLGEITFKVFPRPAANLTLKLRVANAGSAARIMMEAASTRWEPDAIDLPDAAGHVCLRLAGPETALDSIAKEILGRWPGEIMTAAEANSFWAGVREFTWAWPEGLLVKIVLSPARLVELDRQLKSFEDVRVHFSVAGNLAFASLAPGMEAGRLDVALHDLGLAGVTLSGRGPLWLGVRAKTEIAIRVKEALDPQGRFPSMDE